MNVQPAREKSGITVTAATLEDFGTRLLAAAGVPGGNAALVARTLVAANLRGIDSHGVARLRTYVDMLTLALEAGSALSTALQVATARMPESPLRRAFARVQNDLRSGRLRADALRALAERVDTPAVTSLVAALVQAESNGGSLAGVLRSQADQRLNERFARAERLALEAPVKLLAPLILCIFPCTFLVLAFPVAIRFLESP